MGYPILSFGETNKTTERRVPVREKTEYVTPSTLLGDSAIDICCTTSAQPGAQFARICQTHDPTYIQATRSRLSGTDAVK